MLYWIRMKQDGSEQGRKSEHILHTLPSVLTFAGSEKFASRSKTSANYWAERVFKLARKNSAGVMVSDADYSCQLSFGGRRERFQLHTPNKAEAASRAAAIYRDVTGRGWDDALLIHKPKALPKAETLPPATVGGVIAANARLSSARAESLDAYSKAFRRIAAGVMRLAGGRKYDAFRGGREEWRARIDGLPLSALTPSAVLAWKNAFLKAARGDGRGRAAVTVNSIIRNAKALLGRKVRGFIEQEMLLPSPLWHEGIPAEPEPSLRYRSRIDAEAILRAAQGELAAADAEAFKLLLLTLGCGLRRSEADTLAWEQFDFQRRVLVIEDTAHKRLKSRDSAGEIDLEPELCALFQGFRARARGGFVLEASHRLRIAEMQDRESRGYRCNETHKRLLAWLREHGVPGLRPMHTMRKEVGSIIASRHGIWQASRYLRHSDIRITSKLYADKKLPVTSGLGSVLAVPANIVAADFRAADAGNAAVPGKAGRRRA